MHHRPLTSTGLFVRLIAALATFVVLGHVYITLIDGLHRAGTALS